VPVIGLELAREATTLDVGKELRVVDATNQGFAALRLGLR
jgi:hypothetical protein